MTSKRNRTKPAARPAAAPTSTIEQAPAGVEPTAQLLAAEDELALELGPSPLDELAPPRPAAVSSPPANRVTAAEPKPVVDGTLTRCPKCGSTERTGYANRRELRHNGTSPTGQPYNLVVWRDTRCAVCLQLRCDRHYEQTEPVAAASPLAQV